MLVTKQQILNGISTYIENDIVPNLPNTNLKIVVRGFAASILFIPKLADKVLEHPWAVYIKTEDGKYNLDSRILEKAFGNDKLVISKKIPLLTDGEVMDFSFDVEDVKKIVKYIGG